MFLNGNLREEIKPVVNEKIAFGDGDKSILLAFFGISDNQNSDPRTK